MHNFKLKTGESYIFGHFEGNTIIVLIACSSRFACNILLSAVGGSNFWLITNLEADLQESLLKGIFPTYSEFVGMFGLDCFNKRIHF